MISRTTIKIGKHPVLFIKIIIVIHTSTVTIQIDQECIHRPESQYFIHIKIFLKVGPLIEFLNHLNHFFKVCIRSGSENRIVSYGPITGRRSSIYFRSAPPLAPILPNPPIKPPNLPEPRIHSVFAASRIHLSFALLFLDLNLLCSVPI